jgi:hypothetical protein
MSTRIRAYSTKPWPFSLFRLLILVINCTYREFRKFIMVILLFGFILLHTFKNSTNLSELKGASPPPFENVGT